MCADGPWLPGMQIVFWVNLGASDRFKYVTDGYGKWQDYDQTISYYMSTESNARSPKNINS